MSAINKKLEGASEPTPIRYPDKWNPEFPQMLLDLMEQGRSVISFCAKARISRTTFYNWVKSVPEFLEAFEVGKVLSQAYYEEQGQDNLKDKDFNYGGWKFLMINRFPDDWKLRQEIHNTGEKQQPVLSKEEFDERFAKLNEEEKNADSDTKEN